MTLKDIMTSDPLCCLPGHTAVHAAQIMKQAHVGVVPVIDSEQGRKPIGVVTDRDLCLTVIAQDRQPSTVQVQDCMTKEVVTASLHDTVAQAAERMGDQQIRRLLVVDDQGILQGIVATADLVQRAHAPTGQTHETLAKVTEPSTQASKPREQMVKNAA